MHLFRRVARGLVFLLFFGRTFTPAAGQDKPQKQDGKAVTIAVTVMNQGHHPVVNLRPEEFALFEDDKPQQITSVNHSDVPACVGLLLDSSGSMLTKHAAAAAAMLNFVKKSNAEDQFFVVNFNEESYLDQDFTKDINLLRTALNQPAERRGTAFYDTVYAAADHLIKARQCEKRVLILATDGDDNSSYESLHHTIDHLRAAGSPIIYAIGLSNNQQPKHIPRTRSGLEELTAATGGAVLFVDDLKEIAAAAERFAEEIRNQYSVAYIPNSQRKGKYQRLKVEINAPGYKDLVVRVRPGYVLAP